MNHHITIQLELPDQLSEARTKLYLDDIRHSLANIFQKRLDLPVAKILPGPYHVELEDVRNFHEKFQVPMSDQPALLDEAAHNFRRNFLREELRELDQAYATKNIHEAGDALVDLVYVAIGTALMMGLPWPEMWATVQRVNMTKRLAKPDGSDSKRNNPLDVIKPEGFKAADHWEALGERARRSPFFDATAAVLSLAELRKQSVSDVGVKTEPEASNESAGTPAPSPSV